MKTYSADILHKANVNGFTIVAFSKLIDSHKAEALSRKHDPKHPAKKQRYGVSRDGSLMAGVFGSL